MAILALLAGLLMESTACTSMRNTDQSSRDMRVAADPGQPLSARTVAARRLNGDDRAVLRRLLCASLPGDWTEDTINAIVLLGIVGNAETIPLLEELDKRPNEASGKFHGVIQDSVASIRIAIR
jgi:hypothetical protein